MNITASAYKSLLREYDEKQLKSQIRLKQKKEKIEGEIPRISEINAALVTLNVKEISSKLKGLPLDLSKERGELIREKEALLKTAGYSKKDLEPEYECPLCRDTGFINSKPCNCFKARITDILYDQSNIRETLKNENFEHFSLEYYSDEPVSSGSPLTERQLAERALNAAKDFVTSFDTSQNNLLISGGCGVGKTFLSNCIAKEIIEKGRFVVYLSAIKLFEILSASSFEKDVSSRELAAHIYECDLLIIDDLGSELSNSFTAMALFNCINERLTGRKHTIITTNLSARRLQETYSERIFSRITNSYTMIKLLGSDIRVKKRLEN